MKDINKILAKACKYEYVSFDIFDTLILRNTLKPADIFQFVELELEKQGIPFHGFSQARIEGEKEAIRLNNDSDETTLDKIYDCIAFKSAELRELAKQTEIRMEQAFCICNGEMQDMLKKLKQGGKKIIIISDMYLSAAVIATILRRCNITYDYLYVSSEYGIRKSSGKLFRKVINDLGIAKSKMIHIGDNKRSDYLMPRLMGIEAILYEKRLTSFIENNPIENTLPSRTIQALKQNYTAGKEDNFAVGYNYLGPLLAGYCQWLHGHLEKEPKRLLFFARDGYIMQKAYNGLYPNSKSDYVAISRRSVTVPMLEHAENWKDVVRIVGYVKREETWCTLLHKMGFDGGNEYVKILSQKYGEKVNKEYLLHDAGLDEAFDIIQPQMKEIARNEKVEAKKYLDSFFDDSVAIADIGWYGTMQQTLRSFFADTKVKMEGYYIGLLQREGYDNSDMHGFLYDEVHKTSLFDAKLIYGFNGLIESFFSANHGSTQKYENGNPVYEAWESGNWPVISKVHEGALHFCRDIKTLIDSYDFSITAKEAYSGLHRVMTKPESREIGALGELVFFDAYYEPLVKRTNLFSYIAHPKGLLHDLMTSNWKIGFIRNLTGLRAADKIYLAMMKAK